MSISTARALDARACLPCGASLGSLWERAQELSRAVLTDWEEGNVWGSHDPAPPSKEKDVKKLRQMLLDEDVPLFDRYRAMFSLRNIGDDESILALAAGLQCSSALFRHEIAFVLGQVSILDVKDPREKSPLICTSP